MPFDYEQPYHRTVHFQDTDAAGVVFFANILTICHEAYEYSLQLQGINLKLFFSNSGDYAVPIVRAEVDFFKPIFCGDRLLVELKPQQIDSYSFTISYKVTNEDAKVLSTAQTKHVCISTSDRTRLEIPEELQQWINGL
ncbi:putative thioesterase [Synechococcus sp. PCC 7502]|uniref:acyl-CoA thioesterase n=1 Tax=Synechococcus sp. PCC 7502 TaxID=1173263 RepID=UPI00029FBD06|nr:thioesterase family protein [Synechococcus sp. PCC 7502]AFY73460.1 putative thioesterase [Synechococcus sp. PCC 7502]